MDAAALTARLDELRGLAKRLDDQSRQCQAQLDALAIASAETRGAIAECEHWQQMVATAEHPADAADATPMYRQPS